MYKTKDIEPKELNTFAIKNQDEILQHTGSKLDLVKAWEVIKNTSNNYTKSDEKVQEADTLLYQILNRKQESAAPKQTNSKKQKVSSSEETLEIQEKERSRALALLELELELLIAA
ncbi:hypothetical protein [Flavivirga rizhaonensis]|uniref:Uncharacterized protein n=1 Tax=Flavivirga rizhaonensis TaxID=2559571 RepID=A0A4S1E126_9FLAO|nr:hypothetical protein [Flavivirga rizhaonensis]TGV03592.1 hypothetical protein EM932_06085 [Flavivirga rizhaonensis]